MHYSLKNISESFMNKIEKVRHEAITNKIIDNLGDSLNTFPFKNEMLGKFLADRFNGGRPFNYSDVAVKPIGIGSKLFFDFEQEYNINEKYTFNELRFFKNVTCPKSLHNYAEWPNLMTEITVPDYWTTIPENAFKDFRSVETINFSNKITEFGDNCFDCCENWTNAHLTPTVTKIGKGIFSHDTIPDFFEIPRSITAIPDDCFYECKFIDRNFKIPNSITEIGNSAFEAVDVASIFIPNSVRKLNSSSFARNDKLISVRLPAGLTEIPFECFTECISLKKIALPEGIKTLEEKSFFDCEALKSLNLPSSLYEIKENAFLNTGIKKITVHSRLQIHDSNLKGVYRSDYDKDSPLEKYALYIPNELKDYYLNTLITECAKSVHYF